MNRTQESLALLTGHSPSTKRLQIAVPISGVYSLGRSSPRIVPWPRNCLVLCSLSRIREATMGKIRVWTAEEDELLLGLIAQRKSALLIAGRLQRTTCSVRERGRKLGAALESVNETRSRYRIMGRPEARQGPPSKDRSHRGVWMFRD